MAQSGLRPDNIAETTDLMRSSLKKRALARGRRLEAAESEEEEEEGEGEEGGRGDGLNGGKDLGQDHGQDQLRQRHLERMPRKLIQP